MIQVNITSIDEVNTTHVVKSKHQSDGSNQYGYDGKGKTKAMGPTIATPP